LNSYSKTDSNESRKKGSIFKNTAFPVGAPLANFFAYYNVGRRSPKPLDIRKEGERKAA
jgi:hypothetical protein